ncbi:hypothetical protein EVJ32_10830 [Exiguobacterium sp. SH5S4]|uniref:DUF5411 family protein n=1 Tax=Exiguobacterium sp. SH5S4 TaxID=2510961 RepID=UPI00103E3272|nr:DUF5411 family protein [Exiguobacterium sp. SH5S4]TCI25285.1 hypothetical protein EVJ32_10830 [Exiguobacterium sp. SH5S4]
MSKVIWGGLVTFFAMFVIVFYVAYNETAFVATDNQNALDNGTRNALNQSVNMGHLRVSEEVTIDPEIAKEALVRNYAQSVNYRDGDRFLNIYYLTDQPIIATDAYTSLEGSTNFTKKEETISRSRNVYIIEAKKLNR